MSHIARDANLIPTADPTDSRSVSSSDLDPARSTLPEESMECLTIHSPQLDHFRRMDQRNTHSYGHRHAGEERQPFDRQPTPKSFRGRESSPSVDQRQWFDNAGPLDSRPSGMIPVRSRPTSTADLPSAPISALLGTSTRQEKRQRSGSPDSLRPSYAPGHPYRSGPVNGEHQILRLPSFNSVRRPEEKSRDLEPG
jgi:hypothetical protein